MERALRSGGYSLMEQKGILCQAVRCPLVDKRYIEIPLPPTPSACPYMLVIEEKKWGKKKIYQLYILHTSVNLCFQLP